jgi:hypothetical protein
MPRISELAESGERAAGIGKRAVFAHAQNAEA